jgi:hypothetical protein
MVEYLKFWAAKALTDMAMFLGVVVVVMAGIAVYTLYLAIQDRSRARRRR